MFTRRSKTSRRAVGEMGELGTVEAEGGAPTCSVVLLSDDVARSSRERIGVDEDAVGDEDGEEEEAGQRERTNRQKLRLVLRQDDEALKDAVEMKEYPMH